MPGDAGLPSQNHHIVAEAEWRAAIAALTQFLPTLPRVSGSSDRSQPAKGMAISGPLPVLNETDFGGALETWVVTPQLLAAALQEQRALLPATVAAVSDPLPPSNLRILSLRLDTPLLAERFCLLITPALSVALVLGQPTGGHPCFQYSFDPQVLLALWQQIRQSIEPAAQRLTDNLEQQLVSRVAPPDYRVITHFTQIMMGCLPHRKSKTVTLEERGNLHFSHSPNGHQGYQTVHRTSAALSTPDVTPPSFDAAVASPGADTELLRAMAHEIRTPLTTIRTLTRSLLRRKDTTDAAKQRLMRIDDECTQQIDRFNLIFKAVELETMERERPRSALTPIALTQIFQDAIPRWQQQAQRRNLKLDVSLPPNLPRVTSDPTLLNEVLTGVVEWFTQCLPPRSHVHMSVTLAGHQLKLQFEADPIAVACSLDAEGTAKRQTMKSVGQLLTVIPETGGVSLNLDVTKNLFEFLGGKLIVRQKPDQGEILTAFLPLDTREV
jgi:hypothetical protein